MHQVYQGGGTWGMMNGDARVKVGKTSLSIWWFPKNRGKPPKMDGEYNGKPYGNS